MKHLFAILIVTLMMNLTANGQALRPGKVKSYEHQLADVTEIIDTSYLKTKIIEVENDFKADPGELNKARLGIIYHEVTLNLSFLSKTGYKGYAQKSFDFLTELAADRQTTPELLPIVSAYRASALSLVSAETGKLKLLGEAFKLFKDAVEKYSDVCAAPEFLRGSVAENLPFFFFHKRRFAKNDFQSIIEKQDKNANYADAKIMSFTYWAWANQHTGKKYRAQSLHYLDLAIQLDPDYKAGGKRAEELKAKLQGS